MYYGYIYSKDENGEIFKVFIESSAEFNGTYLTKEEYEKAIAELESVKE